MAGIQISNPTAQGLDGVAFTGVSATASGQFLVTREALEDLEYTMFDNEAAMLEAFVRHQPGVAEGAARALETATAGATTIVLQSLLF